MRIRGSHNLSDGPSHSIIDRAKVAIFHKKRVELELLQATKLVCLVICFDYLIDEHLIKPERVILAQSVRIGIFFPHKLGTKKLQKGPLFGETFWQ